MDRNNNKATNDKYMVEEIEGKGKGVLAKEALDGGTLLMKDTALLEIQHDHMLKEHVARNLWSPLKIIMALLEFMLLGLMVLMTYQNWPIVTLILLVMSWQRITNHITATKSFILFHLSWRDLIHQVEGLDMKCKSDFESLENVFPHTGSYQDWLGIFCTNSFQLGESGQSGAPCRSALFLTVSRLNHSCRANCDYSIQHGSIQVRTTRPVVMGEELTICYNNFLEEEGPVVKSERRAYLMWAYRFNCRCEDCILTGFISSSNDRMRKRLVKLRKDWTLTEDYKQERQIVNEQLSLLGKLDSCGKMEHMLQAIECGWETEVRKREHMNSHVGLVEKKIDKDRAEFIIQLGNKVYRTYFGLDSRESQDWEKRSHKLLLTST